MKRIKVLKILIEKCEDCPYHRCDLIWCPEFAYFCDYKEESRELKETEIHAIPKKCPLPDVNEGGKNE